MAAMIAASAIPYGTAPDVVAALGIIHIVNDRLYRWVVPSGDGDHDDLGWLILNKPPTEP